MKKQKPSGLVRVAGRLAACSIDTASSIVRRAGRAMRSPTTPKPKEATVNKTSSAKAASIAARVLKTGRFNQADVETLAASVLAQKVTAKKRAPAKRRR